MDTDAEVERLAGATVPSIFARHGEAAFRTLERQAIERLAQGEPEVIALGGGAFQASSVRKELLQRGLVVWLDVLEDVLVERIRRSGGRPLLAGADLREGLRALSAERLACYALAHLCVTAVTSAEMTERILVLLDQSDMAAISASR